MPSEGSSLRNEISASSARACARATAATPLAISSGRHDACQDGFACGKRRSLSLQLLFQVCAVEAGKQLPRLHARALTDRCSESRKQLIRRFAASAVLAERMEAQLANGQQISITEHALLCSTLARLVTRIGIDRVPRDVTPSSLREYLAARGPAAMPADMATSGAAEPDP